MQIITIKGKEVQVDDEDADLVRSISWYINNCGYLFCKYKCPHQSKTTLLHQIIKARIDGYCPCDRSYRNGVDAMEIDHICGSKYNNVRSNLQIIPKTYNVSKRKAKTSRCKSIYIGVSKWHGLWRASYKYKNSTTVIGAFNDEESAARARDTEIITRGLKLALNFPRKVVRPVKKVVLTVPSV